MKINSDWLIRLIILLALIVRIIPFNFPSFTSDEARIAYRGYALVNTGKDELGRSFPLVFNSLDDYQLPVVSYTAVLGARIPFILIGTAVVFLIYKLSEYFFKDKSCSFYAALIASLSPGLIFFSKFPNEYIISAFLILLLITQVFNKKISKPLLLIIILLMLLTSKIVWLILIPVLSLSLFFNNRIKRKEKITLLLIGIIPTVIILLFYLRIPQSARSLLENNFLILSDVNVKNGIEKLRAQRVEGWPPFFDRILFNKPYLLLAGIFHWISQISLGRLFTEFDPTGNFGYLKSGAFSKIVIIPFLTGLFFLIRESRKIKFLPLFIIFTTFPFVFLYPAQRTGLIILALPFVILICGYGFKFFSRKIAVILSIFLTVEFIINLFFINSSIKNANEYRPGWTKLVIEEAQNYSANYNIAFSDNIARDVVPFIKWYTKFDPVSGYENIPYPYKFRQTEILNYRIIGSEDTFYNCSLDKKTYIFASKRDLEKIQSNIKVSYIKSYKDLMDNKAVYLMPPTICVY